MKVVIDFIESQLGEFETEIIEALLLNIIEVSNVSTLICVFDERDFSIVIVLKRILEKVISSQFPKLEFIILFNNDLTSQSIEGHRNIKLMLCKINSTNVFQLNIFENHQFCKTIFTLFNEKLNNKFEVSKELNQALIKQNFYKNIADSNIIYNANTYLTKYFIEFTKCSPQKVEYLQICPKNIGVSDLKKSTICFLISKQDFLIYQENLKTLIEKLEPNHYHILLCIVDEIDFHQFHFHDFGASLINLSELENFIISLDILFLFSKFDIEKYLLMTSQDVIFCQLEMINDVFKNFSFNVLSLEGVHNFIECTVYNELLKAKFKKATKTLKYQIYFKKILLNIQKHFKQLNQKSLDNKPLNTRKKKMAYFCILPPLKSGVVDYGLNQIHYLKDFYQITLVINQAEFDIPVSISDFPVIFLNEFFNVSGEFERIFYHMSNHYMHTHMIEIIDKYPGVVELHNINISSLYAYQEVSEKIPDYWSKILYQEFGWKALLERFTQNLEEVQLTYPCLSQILDYAKGTIVHSKHAKRFLEEKYDEKLIHRVNILPFMKTSIDLPSKVDSRKKLGIPIDAFVVSTFGILTENKMIGELLEAWIFGQFEHDNMYLIYVGSDLGCQSYKHLKSKIKKLNLENKVLVTNWVDNETYHLYLAATDIAVQLRKSATGETSSAFLDCLAASIPTIFSKNLIDLDLNINGLISLENNFQISDLSFLIQTLKDNPKMCLEISNQIKNFFLTHHESRNQVHKYLDCIESFYQDNSEKHILQKTLQYAFQGKASHTKFNKKQILIDISTIQKNDLNTGIQRVVKAQLINLINLMSIEYRIDAIYFSDEDGKWKAKYANHYMQSLLKINTPFLEDEEVFPSFGSIYYLLDHTGDLVKHLYLSNIYSKWKLNGVKILSLVYDLLPIFRPDCFPPHMYDAHFQMLQTMVNISDSIVTISESVADDLKTWIEQNNICLSVYPPKIKAVLLGADLESSKCNSVEELDSSILQKIANKTTFIMVGTVEPRKGHYQVVKAFEILWKNNIDINLIIIGKRGWQNTHTFNLIENSQELNKRLFWETNVNDTTLKQLYTTCDCLINASEGEGFGLPIIEAARYKLPLILRNIPVFKEIAGENAYYFDGLSEVNLAHSIETWLNLFMTGNIPLSENMHWDSWEESTKKLIPVLLD